MGANGSKKHKPYEEKIARPVGSQLGKLLQIKLKHVEIQNLQGGRLFIGCNDGNLLEFSITDNKVVYDFGKILDDHIISMAKTFDNKSQFVCDEYCNFKELDIPTRKQANRFNVNSAVFCVITYDNNLITAAFGKKCVLTKWSIRSNKQLHAWKSDVNQYVYSQSCSQDNKYQLIGYCEGWLGLFNLQKYFTVKNIKLLSDGIFSVAFSRDNQSAFISDWGGSIKMIKWQAGANSENDFDFTEKPEKVYNYSVYSVCLTKDEKYLLVGSKELLSIFATMTRKVIKEFKLSSDVHGINLIKDDKMAIIAQTNGNLGFLDLEKMELYKIADNITKSKELKRIAII